MKNDLYVDSNFVMEHVHHSEDSTQELDSFLIVENQDTTLLVQKTEKEYQLIEKMVDRPDFGKNVFVTLIVIFAVISVIKRRKNG